MKSNSTNSSILKPRPPQSGIANKSMSTILDRSIEELRLSKGVSTKADRTKRQRLVLAAANQGAHMHFYKRKEATTLIPAEKKVEQKVVFMQGKLTPKVTRSHESIQ